MKIVAPVQTQQTSLGRHDTTVTAEAGKVAQIQGMTAGLTDAFTAMAKTTAQLNDVRSERQAQQADLYMQKSDKEFWDQWGGRDFFDVDEIPDEFVTEGMHNKGRVMSSDVLPEMYSAHIKTQIPEASRIIETESYRNSWNNKAQEGAIGRQIQIQNRANAETQRQIFEDEQINYQNAEDTDRPDLMLEIANNMHGTADQVEPFKDKARKRAETILYDDLIIEEDISGMMEAIVYLEQDANVYHSDNGKLNTKERLAWINKLEGEIGRLSRVDESENKANLEALRRRITITQSNSLKGKESSIEDQLDLLDQAIGANILNDGTLTAEIMDLEASIFYSRRVNDMNKFPRQIREGYIKSIDGLNLPEFEKNQLMIRLEQANQSLTSAENSNMMQSAVDTGYIKSLVPISLGASLDDTVESLHMRKLQHDSAFANYGVTQGYLTKDESVRISSQINEMTPTEQMGSIAAISSVFGTESVAFYNQLRLEGSADTFSIAGATALNGNTFMAHNMLNGAKYRKENAEEIKLVEPLIDEKVLQFLGSGYDRDARYKASLKTAIKDAYIGSSIAAGENLKTLNTGGWFGTNHITQALEASTGGMLEYNGADVPPPEYGMSQDTFDNWVNTLDSSYIDQLGGSYGQSSEEFLKEIQDGDSLRLVWRGHNQYVVERTNGKPVMNKFGMAFTLKYDINAPIDKRKPLSYQEFMESR